MGNLEQTQPNLSGEWHPTKNVPLQPSDVSHSAHLKVWWLCAQGHEFEKSINSRYNSGRGITKCPVCANRQVLAGFNDLETIAPEISKEWHPSHNEKLLPSQITAKSSQSVWWICEKGHEWQAKPNARVGSGAGCPVCANQKIIPGDNDLASHNPALADEWHPNLNGTLKPDQVAPSSATRVWWLCPKGHEYQAKIAERNSGDRSTNCPFCAHRQLLPGFNDLATTAPEIARQWHPTLNDSQFPSEIFATSKEEFWWQCDKYPKHAWKQKPSTRVSQGAGCGICSGNQIQVGINDLASQSPFLLDQWDYSKNVYIAPTDLTAGSSIKIWWKCELGHEWKQSPQNRKRLGCPICGNKKVLIGYNDLQSTNPEIARFWDGTLNGSLKPTDVTSGSGKKVWWTCAANGQHSYVATVVEVVSGKGCGVCSGRQVIQGVNDLSTHNPRLAAEWDFKKNELLKPSQVTVSSHKKVWWNCSKGHSYQAVIASRTTGTSCPICTNKVVLVGYNDMATTNPEMAIEWHVSKNGELTPKDIVAGSLKPIWWQCEQGHEWKAMAAHRLSGGTGCPACATFGYDPSSPGILYFIEHQTLQARKVGITNVGKSRLSKFQNFGWSVIHLVESQDGHHIANIEKELLADIRSNLQLPQMLGREEMKSTGGWTETFSIDGASNRQIIEKIKELDSRVP